VNRKQRVIYSDNGTLIEISQPVNDFRAGSYVFAGFVAAEDKLYIGTELPFNHKWLEIGVPNDVASVSSVDIWSGSAWIPGVDVNDGTQATSGKALSGSGVAEPRVNEPCSDQVRNVSVVASGRREVRDFSGIDRSYVGNSRRFIGSLTGPQQARNSDGCDDQNDRHNDQQFQQRETTRILHYICLHVL